MAAYDYRCRTCDARFEVRRPVDAPAGAVCCPQGHPEVSRMWSQVSISVSVSVTGSAAAPAPSGGCCGGGCGCH